jgi:TatA/E family protein of Tat protein translocase
MFGSIGMLELVMISLIALIVFGHAKLPDSERSLGESIRDFRKALSVGGHQAVHESQSSSSQP